MRTLIFILSLAWLIPLSAFSHGVAVVNANTASYLLLQSTTQSVTVYDQVATTVTTQVFINQTGLPRTIKYAFPLHEEASATSLRWKVNNVWTTAIITPQPQDTTFPGGGNPNQNLLTYLGNSPLFFTLDDIIAPDSTLIVELTYVELLPYSFGTVTYDYPGDYHLIQSGNIHLQSYHFILESQRNIDSIAFTGASGSTITNTGSHAEVFISRYEMPANSNYRVTYSLAASTMGLYGYSTYLPDSLMVCDSLHNGFFTFIVEPVPDTTQVIDKVFTLIIDNSGSMSGTKMQQAKDAATFIVNHLNPGDYFNIVSFNTTVTSFMPDHVAFNETNKTLALAYISQLQAGGLTNISGAMHTAIEDFAGNDPTLASIVIFFTDGEATTGLLTNQEILASIQNDITFYEVQDLLINTFGIGSSVNQALLSQMASQNNGLSQFLLDNELEEMITQFYLMICNPVLLNISMTFNPPIVSEVYPSPLPNLYIGQQLILAGRYDSLLVARTPLLITFTGQAFGQQQTYNYGFNLADTLVTDYLFTTKIWAMKKIDNLYIQYFTYPPGSFQADSIKNLIIHLSMCYNVTSPFTQFGVPVGMEETGMVNDRASDQVTVYPNPFGQEVSFEIDITDENCGLVTLEIYNLQGNIVQTIRKLCDKPGKYKLLWDGTCEAGTLVGDGFYIYRIVLPTGVIQGKVTKLTGG